MGIQQAPKIIPIEVLRRRHRWRELKFFAWYFLGYSAVVFWAELSMFFFGTFLFFIGSIGFVQLAATWCIGLNLILAFLLTVIGLEDHRLARVRRFRFIALRFHPLFAPMWWPIKVLKFLIGSISPKRTASVSRTAGQWEFGDSSENDYDDDAPA